MICILCIMLGGLGFLASMLGIAGLFFQEQITDFQKTMGDASQQEMQAKMAAAQSSFFIPNLILMICNLLIAPALLIGSIGILIKKVWGQKILSRALIAAAIFILLRTILTSIFQVQFFGIMKETMMEQIPANSGAVEAGTMETVMMASLYFGVAFAIVWALGLAAFYFWSSRYLKKDSTQMYLSTFSPQQ